MEGFPIRGLTLIEEDPQISATPLVFSILKKLQNQGYHVLVVVTVNDVHRTEQLFETARLSNQLIIPVDIPDLSKLMEKLNDELLEGSRTEKRIVYIHCADLLLRFLGVNQACRYFHLLSRATPVLSRLFHETWTDLELSRLYSVCTNVLKLSVAENKTCICETRTEKKDGLIGRKVEQFSIDPSSLTIRSQAYQPLPKHQMVVNEEENSKRPISILPRTTFDMGLDLTEEERQSKASTRLPFTHAQNEEGLVSLNIASGRKVRAGGQIIYTPDEHDDLDDSDPDDDLMI